MDFNTYFVSIALFLLTTITYYLRKHKPNPSKIQDPRPPEPPGAWPIIGHLHLLSDQSPVARILACMADKYGPIFTLRLGSHQGLVLSNSKAIKECFTTNDKAFASRPNMATAKYMGYNYAVFALAPYGPYWRDVRKVVTLELFTSYRLNILGHIRRYETDHMTKELYTLTTKSTPNTPNKTTICMNTWFEECTFNIIIRTLVGKRFSSNESGGDDKCHKLQEAIKKALYYSGVFVLSDAIPWMEWMDIGGNIKGMKRAHEEFDEVLEDWVQERIKMRKERGDESAADSDFMDVMMSQIQEGELMSGFDRETVIKATMLILILTGSESTAETLTWALSLLLNNPHTLKLAQEELQTVVGPHKWVQESDIKNLNYLQAIVKETLRLYPPGPLSGPREATQDCYVGGYFVPKGTRLIVNLLKLHRDPDMWSDPNDFRPERFLNEKKDTNFKGQCFEYIPFSSGRRMCPGMTFGLQVIHLALARVLQGFDVSTPTGEAVDMEEGLGIALPKLKPLEVILTPRLPLELYENHER